MVRLTHATLLTASIVGTIAPLVSAPTAIAQASFKDVAQDFWAKPYIEALAKENILTGFPDGNFQPNAPVTRAQFAAILSKAFTTAPRRRYRPFLDVAADYWAEPAIRFAYTSQFISGSPTGNFEPERDISRAQALVSLASGLQLEPTGPTAETLTFFHDVGDIPAYAKPGVAAAAQNRIPVNYPNVFQLNPNQAATRADVSAFIYQALVNQGRFQPLAADAAASKYIVQVAQTSGSNVLPTGTVIPVALPVSSTPNTQASTSQAPTRQELTSQELTSQELTSQEPTRIVMALGESLETTLVTSEDLFDGTGQLVIPKGSRIKGLFQPVRLGNKEGTQFTATEILIGDRTYPFNASSKAIAARRKGGINLGELTGSVGTAAASSILQTTLGGGSLSVESLLPTLLQVGGRLGRQVNREPREDDRLILVEPEELELKLNQGFMPSQP